jgi:NAD-specific glutamate dehydrogenase
VYVAGALSVDDREKLGWLIDFVGKMSAQAQAGYKVAAAVKAFPRLHDSLKVHRMYEYVQGLRNPITSLSKIQQTNQTLYLVMQRATADR